MAGLQEQEGGAVEQQHALQEAVAAPKPPCDRLRLREQRAPDFLAKYSRWPARTRMKPHFSHIHITPHIEDVAGQSVRPCGGCGST
jgi:hypothetical protein